MPLPRRTTWIRIAAFAVAAMLVLAGYLWLRGAADGSEPLAEWLRIVTTALVAATGSVCLLWWLLRLRYHQVLAPLARFLEEYRQNPVSSPPRLQVRLPTGDKELRHLLRSLDDICTSYRQALTDRVVQNAALDALRSQLGRDGDRGAPMRGNTTSRDMVARFTPNLYWLTATPSLQQFLGWSIVGLNGRPFAEIVHPNDRTEVEHAFQAALQNGEAHNISFRVCIHRAGGKQDNSTSADPTPVADKTTVLRYVQTDMLTRYTEHGVPLHVRCYLVDITEKVRADKELRRRTQELSRTNERLRGINQDLQRLKESYRDLYHRAPVMYFSLDAQGQFVTFNATTLETLGYERDELFRQPYTRLLTPESQRRFLQNPAEYQQAGEVEAQWVKRDGTVIDVWIRSSPLCDEMGQFVRSRSVAQDVTERNRLAGELRRRGDELERANADLRKINNALDEFTGAVAHDLKEPLRTLESYSHFLADEYAGMLGPEGTSYLEYLIKASRRLSNLIEDLLVLAQAGRITNEPRAFDLGEIVALVRKDLDALIQRRNAEFVVAEPLPIIIGDSQRITQLLSNLITNAIKYNDNPRPRILVEVRSSPATERLSIPTSGQANQVTICITDNGIGIEPAHHDQIFGIFRRLHPADQYEGTGAGLAIARKIVEAHHGKIWVESELGQGATFCFTLPAVTATAPTPVAVQSVPLVAEPKHEPPGIAGKTVMADAGETTVLAASGSTILLVEDMPDIALIAQKLAHQAGHNMDWVNTAEAGWDYLQRHRPALVLLDNQLPGMSGVELCQRLRATPHIQDLTVALFSRFEQPQEREVAHASGADFILSKDLLCEVGAWQSKINDMLATGGMREPATSVPG
jgi:PAS domain S-box-containing protein